MEITLHNQSGSTAGKITLNDRLFGVKPNADLIYQVATSQMSNQRQVLAHVKDRSDVRGGGVKPWKQKGTGRARHGSIRSPIWVGGGVAHGPTKDVNFKKRISKVQSRAALASVLSSRVADGQLVVVDELTVPSAKTKDAAALLQKLAQKLADYKTGNRVLVVLSGDKDADLSVRRATANLPAFDVVRAQDLNTLTVLSYPYLITTKEAVTMLERTFGKKKRSGTT